MPGDPIRRLDREQLVTAVHALARQDLALRAVVRHHGPPPLWARPGTFATLLRIILEQQVSLVSARAIFARLREATGAVTPDSVLTLGPQGLRRLGLTRQKAGYVYGLAERIQAGELSFAALARMNDAEARKALLQVRGVGPWTADIYLIMALRRPDVWPAGDLALHLSLQRTWCLRRPPTTAEAVTFAARWTPWRAVAARILWHAYLSEPKQ
jgi:DNA-3-methyladenine glycosylase II